MRRRLWPLVAAVACVPALLAGSGPAAAATPEFSRSDVRELALKMAAPWPKVQEKSGTFPDYSDLAPRDPDTRYGDAFMGYALVHLGIRTDDEELIDAGIRSTSYAVRTYEDIRKRITQSVFENWAVPSTYNLVRKHAKDNKTFKRDRERWEDFLRVTRAERSGITFEYGNHWLVDAAGVLETQRTGLSSNRRDAVLGGRYGEARHGAFSLINERVPALRPPGNRPFVFSDPPDQPSAYRGLSVGIYGHLIRMLGDRASKKARATLRRAVEALYYDTAPDGDSGFFGRSQELVWSSAGTAAGALVAANLKDTSKGDANRYRALADRSFKRLRDAYPIRDDGQIYVPGHAIHVADTMPFLDGYSGAPSMDGIALLMVDFALSELKKDATMSSIRSDRPMSRAIGSGYGRSAMVRKGRSWFVLRLKPTVHRRHRGDLRYDSGLATAKYRTDEGNWFDIVPHRPTTAAPSTDSAGPALRSDSGIYAIPVGDEFSTSPGSVKVKGAIRTADGAWRAPLRARYNAVDCGVELLFAAYPGRTYEYSAFFYGKDPPKRDGRRIVGDDQRVVTEPKPDSVAMQDGYGSAAYPHLVRARMRFRVSKARTVHVKMC